MSAFRWLQRATGIEGHMDDWRIIHGDCISELASLPAASARLVFADPPYNIGIDYGDGSKADRLPTDAYRDWCRRWIDACVRLLTDDGSMWLMSNDENAAHLYLSLEAAGLHFRNTVKWVETFGQFGGGKKFNRTSRPIHYFVRDGRSFVFNADVVRTTSKRQLMGDRRANPNGKILDDVWTISRVAGTFEERIAGFPTQLPIRLLLRIVGVASDPGDTVVDPFNGSGTTGAAALRLGRRYIGIERNAEYAERASERLRVEAERLCQPALF